MGERISANSMILSLQLSCSKREGTLEVAATMGTCVCPGPEGSQKPEPCDLVVLQLWQQPEGAQEWHLPQSNLQMGPQPWLTR